MTSLREQLAEIEHTRWAGWQRHLHSLCEAGENGTLVIPAGLVQRWERQIATPYTGLSEREKDSDRKEVDKTLALLRAAGVDLPEEAQGGIGGVPTCADPTCSVAIVHDAHPGEPSRQRA